MDYRTIQLKSDQSASSSESENDAGKLRVSAIGLGAVKFGRNQGLHYPQPFDLPDDAQVRHLLHMSHDELGINLLDTAPAYGSSEARIGRLLPRNLRDEWVIMTKVGEQFMDGVSVYDFSPEAVRTSVDESLLRLGVDHLDIVLIHADSDDQSVIQSMGTMQALADLRQSGKIRAIGLSSKTVEGGILAVEQGADILMVEYNPANTSQRPLLEYASRQHVSAVIKKALGSGRSDRLVGSGEENPAAACVRFALTAPAVASVIVGTINPDHLRQACGGV